MWLNNVLAGLNAFLNGVSALFLGLGWLFIRRRRVRVHRFFMLMAFAASSAFLCSYLVRVYLGGVHRFGGEGWIRVVYLFVLSTHVVLAMVVLPLVLVTLYFALRGWFKWHRSWARWTFPVWMYVSVTGIVVYVMLYWLYTPM